MPYITKKYEEIYNLPYEDSIQEQIEALRNSDILKYRIKTIKSGEMLESEIFPIWKTGAEVKDEEGATRPEQKNLNNKNIRKKITRLLNANFTDADVWITVGYRNGALPATEEEARKDVVNYIRRLQRYCEKSNLPKLKYVYVTEFGEDTRIHHHIVTNFPDRDIAEQKWGKGKYPQSRRLKPDDYGLEGLARYVSKDPKGNKSYGYSLNLYKPWEHATTADSKMTKRKAERISRKEIEPKVFFEKLYKGYEFLDLEVKRTDFVSGCYIYARMRKKAEPKPKKPKNNKKTGGKENVC